jgi:hypothetical protein
VRARRHLPALLGAAVVVSSIAAGCGGDGVFVSVDSAQEEPPPVETVTLSSIQASIFTPRCAIEGGCHAGVDAQLGQDLSDGKTHASIVGVESQEIPGLLRVAPGDPDGSYLLMKVSGDPRIAGERMPYGGPYLETGEIEAIRAWIEAGALDN